MSQNNVTAIIAANPKQQALKQLLERAKPAMQGVATKHMTPEKMVRVALLATSRTPKLLDCTPQSILLAVMQASSLGLEVGGVLGHGYLVPYGNEAQFIPGYRGLIDLARRGGQVSTVEARVVLDDDEAFHYELGLLPRLIHRPGAGMGEMTHVYAIARFRDGSTQFEVMNRVAVDAIRKRSRAGTNGPWVTDYAEMARKTVVKRLMKYLPLSVELAAAIELDNRAETGEVGTVSDAIDIAAPDLGDSVAESARERIAAKAAEVRAERGEA